MDQSQEETFFESNFVRGAAATLALAAGLAFVVTKKAKLNNGKTVDTIPGSEQSVPGATESCENSLDDESFDDFPGGPLTVLYGSQTGTSEAFSNQIQEQGHEHGFKVRIIDLEDIETDDHVRDIIYSPEYLDPKTNRVKVVFIVSTYGEGEPTDNALNFFNILKSKLGIATDGPCGMDGVADSSFFEKMDYMVFGLGNKQYEHFNLVGKFFDSALEQLSAKRIVELGIGDDDDDLEGDYESWKSDVLWPTLKAKFVDNDSGTEKCIVEASSASKPNLQYSLKYVPVGNISSSTNETNLDLIQNSSKFYFNSANCPITVSRELRSTADGGSTLHMEIDVSKVENRYHTADNLAILPVNSSKVVESVATALGFDLDAAFVLDAPLSDLDKKFQLPFPSPCTVADYLGKYCDLVSPPRRSEIKILSNYTTDPVERSNLEFMASKEGKEEYDSQIISSYNGIAKIVSELATSINMSLEEFVSMCPRLQPRYYTISSSSSMYPNSVHVTASITAGKQTDGSDYKGVCTGHLSSLAVGDICRVFVRNSSFRLPSDTSKPVIMIGPGTGIAPMRALLQERSYQKLVEKKSIGRNVLYYGCKARHLDYIYESELDAFQKDGILDELHVAFSREQEEKVYVQHLLENNGCDTWNLIDKNGASVFVCGGTRMGHDVVKCLSKIASEFGGLGEDDAKSYFDKLHKEGRFVQELWS